MFLCKMMMKAKMVFILHFKISGVLRVNFLPKNLDITAASPCSLLAELFECNCTWCLSRSYEMVAVRDDIFRKPFWGN